MITTCPNCSGRMLYDVSKAGLSCVYCGTFIASKDFPNDPKDDEIDSIDFNLYTCKTCGAEIIANDTESSTFCVSCGNPTIVFNRITKYKKPKMILPFTCTKEKAMSKVDVLKKGLLVSKDFKNAKVEQLHGIYVPYYVSSVEYDGSVIKKYTEKHGDTTETYYSKCSAYASYKWVTTDASKALNDAISVNLEPFNFTNAVKFNENYLAGFYSDIPDVTKSDAIGTAKRRVINEMSDRMLSNINSDSYTDIRESAEVYSDPVLALFPVWALTLRQDNKPYTILVNGQTGKLVGSAPLDKKKFFGLMAIATLIVALLLTPLMAVVANIFADLGITLFSLIVLGIVIAVTIAIGVLGFRNYKAFKDSLSKTTEENLNKYSTDRQGGTTL